MTLESALALALATIVLGLSPGPAVFATMARALSRPLPHVYLFILGIVTGDFVFAMLAMFGMAAVAGAYAPVFTLLRVAGGAYLVYLGVHSWRDSAKATLRQVTRESSVRLFLSGFLLTGGNPKDLLFFVGFLPLFVNLKTAGTGTMALAAGVIVMSFVGTLSVYAIGAAALKRWIQNERVLAGMHRVAGIVMGGVGLAVMAG